jgi:putative protease
VLIFAGMKNNKVKLELLAPAGNLEAGKAAILAGADAVYIGGPNFSARAAAANEWEDIEALVVFAHQYYVRVYLALNTILFDNELSSAKKAIEKAYRIGVDAVIIQDMGVLEMDLPPIRLFASTQTDNYNVERIKFLASSGLERIILARELSLEQIEDISSQLPGVELESFVHGALCVSFSGRCYFSAALSGRSANRGQCQQVCRLPFDLVDSEGKVLAKNKYLLSLKDFNLSSHIKELADVGVTSFKIEGRLKDAVYVANVTAFYRKELDKVINESSGRYERLSSGIVSLGFEPDINKTFNRGYTEYFFSGRKKEAVISPDNNKSLGEFVGRVKNVFVPKKAKGDLNKEGYFILDRENDLQNGDGVCWLSSNKELIGTNINLVDGEHIYPNKLPLPLEGVDIYRNQNPFFEKSVLNGLERRIAVKWLVREAEGGISIVLEDEDGNIVKKDFLSKKEIANNGPTIEESWRRQLSKSGVSIFYTDTVAFSWDKPLFSPLSLINEYRREMQDLLLKTRLEKYKPEPSRRKELEEEYRDFSNWPAGKKLDYSLNIANQLAKDFYSKHGGRGLEDAFEKNIDIPGRRLMITRHCLRHWLGACTKKVDSKNLSFKEPLYLMRDGKKYRLKFDCANCQMEIYDEEK